MSELADEADSKSAGSNIVWVQVPLPVPIHFMLIVLSKQNVDSEVFYFGVLPSGKAQDFDSCIVGSNPATPAKGMKNYEK